MSVKYSSHSLFSSMGEIRDGLRNIGKFHNAVSKGSLPEQLKNTLVNPVTFVESSLIHHPEIDNILYSCNDIYLSLYLAMASRLVQLDVDAVRVTRVLEKLATDRDPVGALAGVESIISLGTESKLFQEVFGTSKNKLGAEAYSKYDGDDEKMGVDSTKSDKVFPMDSLSVGKNAQLTFTSGRNSIVQPITIRLSVSAVPPKVLQDIYKANYVDHNIISNLKNLTVLGEGTLMDVLTGANYIRRQERLYKADVDGQIRRHFRENAKDVAFAVLTGEVAINRASGIMVLDRKNLRALESSFRGRIDDFKDRNRLMEGTACMLMVVVDDDEDMVTFHLKGIKNSNRLKFSQVKMNSSGNGAVDIQQVMAGAMAGSVPSLT